MTALAGFVVLLSRTTGDEDLVVGSVIANRQPAEVEPLIGFLANTLVLRVDLSGEPTFETVLDRVREVCLGAWAHALPPEKVIEGLAGERAPGDRLFDVWFQMESARREELELAGLEWGPFEVARGETRFELSLVLEEDGDAIRGEIEYDAGLFDAATVEALRTHLLTLYERMIADPGQPVSELALASRQQDEALSRAFTVDLESQPQP
jgi:non-ribosomal peptide synthetase component F